MIDELGVFSVENVENGDERGKLLFNDVEHGLA